MFSSPVKLSPSLRVCNYLHVFVIRSQRFFHLYKKRLFCIVLSCFAANKRIAYDLTFLSPCLYFEHFNGILGMGTLVDIGATWNYNLYGSPPLYRETHLCELHGSVAVRILSVWRFFSYLLVPFNPRTVLCNVNIQLWKTWFVNGLSENRSLL